LARTQQTHTDTRNGERMSTGHLPHGDPVWGSSSAQPRPWGWRQTLAAFGIAAVIAAFGAAVIYAANGHTSSQFAGPPGPGGGPPAGPPGPGGALGPGGAAAHSVHDGPPLHGQVVVADGAGGYVTMMSQTGVVTAVTPDSLTVRSTDGFTQTWAAPAGQAAGFAVDDSVMVRGEQTAGAPAPNVTQVLDPLVSPR
jgi:hypothetical protein